MSYIFIYRTPNKHNIMDIFVFTFFFFLFSNIKIPLIFVSNILLAKLITQMRVGMWK